MQKKGRKKQVKKREPNKDLKIYSPDGKLIFIAREGFNFNYQELIRQKGKNRFITTRKGL